MWQAYACSRGLHFVSYQKWALPAENDGAVPAEFLTHILSLDEMALNMGA